jgi:nitrite reductase (NADH) large subunit
VIPPAGEGGRPAPQPPSTAQGSGDNGDHGMKHYVIVGNGAAGTTAAEHIRKNDRDGKITILTEEELPFYYRIRLIDYLGGDIEEGQLIARDEDWYGERGIKLMTGVRVAGGDPAKRLIQTENGEEFSYDRLLLATGSYPFLPPITGTDTGGTFTLRNIRDARAILSCCLHRSELVMIGGGLLGLETGNALRRRGMNVTVVEFLPRLLPRQLDVRGAAKLTRLMEDMGFTFHIGKSVGEILGKQNVERVILQTGEEIPAEVVIVAAGVRPNLELARRFGLKCDRGIVVDSLLRSSRPQIFAAGDAAEHNGVVYGIWPAAVQQGRAAGTNMAGGSLEYRGTTMVNRLKVAGIDLASMGKIDPENRYRSEVEETETVYRKRVYDDDDKLIGGILLGDISDYGAMAREIGENRRPGQGG